MKKVSFLLMLLTVLATVSFAQPNNRMNRGNNNNGGCSNIPDLTEEQQTQIQEMQVENMKQMLDLRNQIQVKQAELRILRTADKVDMSKVNAKINEIGELSTKMHIQRAEMHNNVRNILTEEQRIYQDMRSCNNNAHRGNRQGHEGNRQGHKGNRGHGQYMRNCPNNFNQNNK